MEKDIQNKEIQDKKDEELSKLELTKEELAAERKKRKEEKAEAKLKNKEKKEKAPVTKQPENKAKVKNVLHETYQSNAKIVRTNKGKPVYVSQDKKNILITSALPYINNEPHLGNIIGCVLSADVFARYSRLIGNNTLYVCGTDEYGTATETKALKEGCTPQELCDKFHKLHREIYDWFDCDFDIFGRTPTDIHTEITLDIFNKLKSNNNILKQKVEQLKCKKCDLVLADRYLYGICYHPGCDYAEAGGDQCDKCGKLTNAIELKDPKCKLCHSSPEKFDSFHYFIDLPKIEPTLKSWFEQASTNWTKNSINISKGFLQEGLKPRCITRDLKWGVKVPDEDKDFENKVFYVWFDAPIGYLSITGDLVKEHWEDWWKNPENVSLYQFMGKDNVTFHTIMFPSSCLGTGDNYTKLNHLSTTEYLTYEGDKFSKSNNIGVFGSNAKDTGIPSEIWRYYLIAIRPETGDTDFFWDKFAEKVNSELKNNLGNLCHRVFSFINTKFDKQVPVLEKGDVVSNFGENEISFISKLEELFKQYIDLMDKVKLKEGLEVVMKISSEGNNYLQKTAPWDVYKTDIEGCKVIMTVLITCVRFIAAIAEPFIPSFSAKIYEIMNIKYDDSCQTLLSTFIGANFKERFIGLVKSGDKVNECAPLFAASKFLLR